jgi:hypothetical protein
VIGASFVGDVVVGRDFAVFMLGFGAALIAICWPIMKRVATLIDKRLETQRRGR